MKAEITRDEVKQAVEQAEAGFPHKECSSCDCFHGFLTQLEIDAVEDVSDLTGGYKVSREEMHGCLGCDPFVLDLNASDGQEAPVLTAAHGTGKWNFDTVEELFVDFLKTLAK